MPFAEFKPIADKLAAGHPLTYSESLELYRAWQREKQIAEGAAMDNQRLRSELLEVLSARKEANAAPAPTETTLEQVVNYLDAHRAAGSRGWSTIVDIVISYIRGGRQQLPEAPAKETRRAA